MIQKTEQPRIAHILAGHTWGGAERFFIKLCAALQSRGYPQKVIVSPEPQRVAELRDAGCDVSTIRFPRGALGVLAQPILRRILNDFDPAIVLCTLKRAVRILPSGRWTTLARVGGYYKIKNYKNCDHLIAITPDIQRYLINEGWPEKQISMIPSFGGVPASVPIDRQTFNTPRNAKVVLGIGRLHPVKGFDTLIKAIARLPDVYLWLAGNGPERAKLELLARDVGVMERTRFLGWRHDQSAIYAAADVVAMPSRHEPFGLVILEAWSTRRPLVAAAAEGPNWLISHGADGLLHSIDSVGELASNLEKVLSNPRLSTQLANAGWARFQNEFSEDAICHAYAELFDNILSNTQLQDAS